MKKKILQYFIEKLQGHNWYVKIPDLEKMYIKKLI